MTTSTQLDNIVNMNSMLPEYEKLLQCMFHPAHFVTSKKLVINKSCCGISYNFIFLPNFIVNLFPDWMSMLKFENALPESTLEALPVKRISYCAHRRNCSKLLGKN